MQGKTNPALSDNTNLEQPQQCDRCLQDLARFVGSQVVVLRQKNCMQQALAAEVLGTRLPHRIESNTQCDYISITFEELQ